MTTTHRHTTNKGMSLTEITVVLALVSIVSLLVVSFTMLINVRSVTAATKNRVVDDVRLSKVVLENWIESVTATYNTEVMISDDNRKLMATIDGVLYTAELTENGLTATLPDGKSLQCPIGVITAFSFEKMKKVDGEQLRDAIWFCSAEYELPSSGSAPAAHQTIFCINPHVGDFVS